MEIAFLARIEPNELKPLGRQTSFFEELAALADVQEIKLCAVDLRTYLDEATHVDVLTSDRGQWRIVRRSMPTTVYDRYISLDSRVLRQRRKRLEERHNVFNGLAVSELVSDKWRTYELLAAAFPRLQPFTCLAEGFTKAANRFGPVIVAKPRRGSRSEGIEILHRRNGSFVTGDDVVLTPVEISVAYRDHVLQDYVEGPPGLGGNVRTLVQQAAHGMRFVGAYARYPVSVGSPSLSGGMRAMPIEEYCDHLDLDETSFSNGLRTSSLEITKAIAGQVGETFELGIDFIFDGKDFYCIEANSKPGRFGFKVIARLDRLKPGLREKYATIRRTSLVNILEYAMRRAEASHGGMALPPD